MKKFTVNFEIKSPFFVLESPNTIILKSFIFFIWEYIYERAEKKK